MNKNENEARQKTSGSEEKKGMSPRELYFRISLLGSLLGIPTPQNVHYSEHSNDPIPDDIRANKKDGDSTIRSAMSGEKAVYAKSLS